MEYGLRDSLFTACKVGDVDVLHTLLQLPTQTADTHQQSESHSPTVLGSLSLLNEPVDSSGFTLLHVASAAAQKATVRLLMDAGADPACRCENSVIECDTNTCVHSQSSSLSSKINIAFIFVYRDNKGRTPYIVAPDKDTRNVFRKYMGDNPDRYDYKKAQVRGQFDKCPLDPNSCL